MQRLLINSSPIMNASCNSEIITEIDQASQLPELSKKYKFLWSDLSAY